MPEPSRPSHTTDYVVIGAGMVGLCMAYALKQRDPSCSVILLEKEDHLGKHASGRNSGVIHSGIYYPTGSLKARLCVAGAKALKAFCAEHALPLQEIGKLICPSQPEEQEQLTLLYERALTNGAQVELVDEIRLKELEPHIDLPVGQALFSPQTAILDPKATMGKLAQQLRLAGVELAFDEPLVSIEAEAGLLKTPKRVLSFGHLYNTAGAFADCIAHRCGVGFEYTMLPFKGMYYELNPASALKFNHLIYPVPDLRVPFLGVHVTPSLNGTVYFGPTALPALGREHYEGLSGIDWLELPQNLGLMTEQYLTNRQGFRNLAHQELLRLAKPQFLKAARSLVPQLSEADLLPSKKVGIRAQLFNTRSKQLEMDFLVEAGPRSTHILNAVSPAYTSAFSVADFVLDSQDRQANVVAPSKHPNKHHESCPTPSFLTEK